LVVQVDACSFGPRTPYEREASIDEVFTRRAAESPASIALAGDGFATTYAELESESNRIANHLRASGVRAGATVGIEPERSRHLPAALLGILKAGAAYVPLDPAYPRERLASMIEDARLFSILATSDRARFAETGTAHVLHVADARAASDERPAAYANPAAALAYVSYTSGSSGRPKGVAVEHRGVVRLVRSADYVDLAPADIILHHSPLSFDASTFEIWGALLNGARLALPTPGLQAPEDLAATIERLGVTTIFLTTALFVRFVDAVNELPASLRCVLTGGEVCSAPHARRFLERFPDCRLVHVYGPTENTTFSTARTLVPDDVAATNVPIGRPIANSSAYVLDAHLEPVVPGEPGELCVGGDGVARGYLNAPELTRERFVPDRFAGDPAARLYRTGDRARFRADGSLEFLGRSDRQVKVRGHRVEPGEIEAALTRHPNVGEAAVVVVERGAEKELVAHVVPSRGSSLNESELRAHLKELLPAYTLPHKIILRAHLPLGPTGKIDRHELARAALPATIPAKAATPRFSRDPEARGLERAIAAIWRDALGSETDPGLDENFFDAGGDSLRLLSVRKNLNRSLGVSLSATDLFEQTTIRKLVAFVIERKGALV
jgi:amino acid adenylation domain-containing protein